MAVARRSTQQQAANSPDGKHNIAVDAFSTTLLSFVHSGEFASKSQEKAGIKGIARAGGREWGSNEF